MEFARTVLSLPVPRVLAWDGTDRIAIGTKFIIMEEAKGSQLHDAWKDLSLRAKLDIIPKIVDVERKMLSISFDRMLPSFSMQKLLQLMHINSIGSLYFNDSDIPNCEPATTNVDSREINEYIKSRFYIGPIVRREFWEKGRSEMHQCHGPCMALIQSLPFLYRAHSFLQRNHQPCISSRPLAVRSAGSKTLRTQTK